MPSLARRRARISVRERRSGTERVEWKNLCYFARVQLYSVRKMRAIIGSMKEVKENKMSYIILQFSQ